MPHSMLTRLIFVNDSEKTIPMTTLVLVGPTRRLRKSDRLGEHRSLSRVRHV